MDVPTSSGPPVRHPHKAPGSQLTTIVMLVVVTGILYIGRDVLIPLALSVLLSFLLAPAVRWLERRRLPRVVATTVMVGLSCCVIAGLVWLTANQFLNVAARLPEYKSNIQSKISILRTDPQGSLGKARRTIDEIGAEIAKQDAADAARPSAPAARGAPPSARLPAQPGRAVPVTIEEAPPTPFGLLQELVTPLLVPLTVVGAVIIFTFIMLLRREDLRDRMIRLVGHGELTVTTQVFEEAAERVSRYLRIQLIINLSYGVPVGVALYAIGVPNAALWGVLATVLRFIPYIGAWIAAAMPIALAFAISDGWSLVVWTVGIFLVFELISNNIIEPWAYGSGTGMSAIAVIAAAIFWTWLWGAVGLLLAMPLTVCLVVMGRHIPRFAFLTIMLGDQPVLSVQDRVYQRLLAHDQEEAAELAETYVGEHGLEAFYEDVLIPVLDLAERDRHSETLSEERARFVFDSIRTQVEDLPEPAADGDKTAEPEQATSSGSKSEEPLGPITVCIVPASDEADEIVGAMLLKRLAARRVAGELTTTGLLKGEALDRVAELAPAAVYISALPPAAVLYACFFCKRLRARFPELKIVVALWHAQGNIEKGRNRLMGAGASEVVTTLKAALASLPSAALVQPMQAAVPASG